MTTITPFNILCFAWLVVTGVAAVFLTRSLFRQSRTNGKRDTARATTVHGLEWAAAYEELLSRKSIEVADRDKQIGQLISELHKRDKQIELKNDLLSKAKIKI